MSFNFSNQTIDHSKVVTGKDNFRKLISDGYFVVPKLLDQTFLERLQDVTNRLLEEQDEEASRAQLSTGSMVNVAENSLFAELVAYPSALEILRNIGAICPRWSSGYIISKPPDSPALFWHQDWWGWDDLSSYTPLPQQLFFMYYLVDTTPENGCLRLLQGSHRKHHKMHDLVPDAHTDELRRVVDPNHSAYRSIKEEINVAVHSGDLVVGDSRLLHSAHSNISGSRRTVITLWYQPFYDMLSEGLRSAIGSPSRPPEWTSEVWKRLNSLGMIPKYDGIHKPTLWNRTPRTELLQSI